MRPENCDVNQIAEPLIGPFKQRPTAHALYWNTSCYVKTNRNKGLRPIRHK